MYFTLFFVNPIKCPQILDAMVEQYQTYPQGLCNDFPPNRYVQVQSYRSHLGISTFGANSRTFPIL